MTGLRGGFRNASLRRTRSFRQGGQAFFAAQLSYSALYDATDGGSATQITDSGGAEVDPLTFGATTAAPWYIGVDAALAALPAVTSNLISTTISGVLDLTGSITLRVHVDVQDWTNVPHYFGGVDTNLWIFSTRNTNTARFNWNPGGGATQMDVTLSPTLSTGKQWLEFAFAPDNGASGKTFTVRGSADGSSWTQLGTNTTATATTIQSSAANVLGVGSGKAGFQHGKPYKLYKAEVYAGFQGGTRVAQFDASLSAATGYTDAVGTGTPVWTVSYGTSGLFPAVKSSVANDLLAGVISDGSNDVATGPVAAIPPADAADSCTLYTVTRPRATMTANMTFFSTRSGTGAGVTLRMASATTVVADVSDGTTTQTTPTVTITPGTRYLLGVIVDAGGTARCFANNTLGSTVARTGNDETGGALTVFANSTPANFCRTHSRIPYAGVQSALTTDQLAVLVTEYGGGV